MDCVVYRCAKQQEMYLYLREGVEISEVPESLRKQMGMLAKVMDLTLSPERKLARADVQLVIAALEEQGFYLQMPPKGLVTAHLYAGD